MKPLFCDFYWEALQFEVAMSQLRTFNMDLHPQTHLQLKIPVLDISCLSVMQIFISIGNHLHRGINKKNTFKTCCPQTTKVTIVKIRFHCKQVESNTTKFEYIQK